MAFLTDLSTELLRLILAAVAEIDLIHLFASRRTCRAFEKQITDMLTKTPSTLGLPIHTFLTTYFLPVFDSLAAGPKYAPDALSAFAPFATLPWASDPSTRSKWDREKASWRSIPLASPSGRLVQRLQQVENEQHFRPGEITYLTAGHIAFRFAAQEEEYIERMRFPHGVPLGLVYDMMVPRDHVRKWKIYFQTRVADPAVFEAFCKAVRVHRPEEVFEEDVKRFFTHDEDYALVFIGTSEWWSHCEGPNRERGELWHPSVIGDDMAFEVDFEWPTDSVKYVPCPPEVRLCFNYPE